MNASDRSIDARAALGATVRIAPTQVAFVGLPVLALERRVWRRRRVRRSA